MKKNLQSHRRMLATAALLCTAGCGSSKEDSNPWEGHTYALTIPETNWTEPPGVGAEFGPFVPTFAIQVESSSGDKLDVVLGALNAEGQQQTCNPTAAVQAVSKSSPGFELGPADMPLYVEHNGVKVIGTIYDVTMTNVLPDGATPAEAGTFSGTMDAREFYPLFTVLMPPTPDAVCNTVAEMTKGTSNPVSCSACPTHDPNGAEAYCFTLAATDLGATEAGTSIQPIDKSSAQTCLD